MGEIIRQLTIDEAVGEFFTLRDALGEQALSGVALLETPEEVQTRHFLMAQYLIGQACPSPRACPDQRCRRGGECRHLIHMQARWKAKKSSHPRRSPGADAVRYAIWVYMSMRGG